MDPFKVTWRIAQYDLVLMNSWTRLQYKDIKISRFFQGWQVEVEGVGYRFFRKPQMAVDYIHRMVDNERVTFILGRSGSPRVVVSGALCAA